MTKEQIIDKMSNEEQNGNIAKPVLGAVLFKQVNYKITILKCNDASLIPVELRQDFEDWIKMKSVELGLGTHCENYYDHDETGKTFVAVDFSVHCI